MRRAPGYSGQMLLAALVGLALAGSVPAPSVHVGEPAPLFSLPAINEEMALRSVSKPHVALSDYTGVEAGYAAKALVVLFVERTGSEGQLAALNHLQRKYGNRGIRFVAVMADSGELASLSAWVESQRLEYPVLRDAYRVVVDRYGVKRFPLTMVVEGSGDIVALGSARDDLEGALEAVIAPLAAE